MIWKTNIKEWEKLNTVLRGWMGYKAFVALKSNFPRMANRGRGWTQKDCFDMVEGQITAKSKNPVVVRKLLRGYLTLGDFQDRFISEADQKTRDNALTHILAVYNATERP